MVNKVAALGALVCIVAAALSTGLLLTDEFVEVFVALGNGETSCAIGFLGVNEAGFDASCLTAEELEISSLGGVDPDGNKVFSIEAFTAPTEEFKLLFPTQEGFFEEINPFFDDFQECATTPTPTPTCNAATFAFAFPTFTGDCDAHYPALQAGQVATFVNGQVEINALLAQLFGQLPVQTIVGAIYDQSTFAGLVSVLSSTTQGGVDALIASPLFPFPFSATETFDQLNATDSALFLGTFASAGVGAIIAGDNSTDQIVSMAGRMAAFAAANGNCPEGVNLTSCFVSALGADLPDVTGNNYAGFTYPAAYCEIVTSTNSVCGLDSLSPPVISALLQLIGATDEEEVETLALLNELLGGWNGAAQIASLGFTGNVTIINDVGAQVEVNIATADLVSFGGATSTLAWVGLIDSYLDTRTNSFEYPDTKEEAFEYCTFLQAIGLYGSLAQTTCSFEFFVEQAADAAFAGGVEADTVGLALSLSTLFGTCFAFIDNIPGAFTDPKDCWNFFPASLLNLAFSGGLQDELFQFQLADNGANVFTAAAKACNDDIADLEAIESAQAISPVGIVFLGAAAVFAVVSVAVNNKVIAGVAGGVSLLGTLLILIALITVYNAPIYASVGDSDDATRGDIIYLAGQTVSLGLGAIAMGAIGGVIMIVSVFTFSASDSAEAKALGAAAEKPVSI